MISLLTWLEKLVFKLVQLQDSLKRGLIVPVINLLETDDDGIDKFPETTPEMKLEVQKHLVKLAVEWEQQRPIVIDFIIKCLSAGSYKKFSIILNSISE